jgi:hypothetical protein
MQHDVTTKAIFFAMLASASGPGFGQDLTLFEAVETVGSAVAAGAAQAREQRNLPNTPEFTLLGTSRIGSKRRVRLVDSNGVVLVVEMNDSDSTPIPDHIGYGIAGYESGKVTLSLPGGAACVGAKDKGVLCTSDGMMELSLTTAAPIVIAGRQEGGDGTPTQGNDMEQEQPENPFAAALRAAAQNEANAQSGRPRRNNGERIEARRIAPEDVPPGMRVVRTPFGDRLVEL